MHHSSIKSNFVLSIGLIISAIILGTTYFNVNETRSKEGRFVSVKGLAEQEVNADIGIWNIKFEVGSNDLDELSQLLKKHSDIIISFLQREGFSK